MGQGNLTIIAGGIEKLVDADIMLAINDDQGGLSDIIACTDASKSKDILMRMLSAPTGKIDLAAFFVGACQFDGWWLTCDV